MSTLHVFDALLVLLAGTFFCGLVATVRQGNWRWAAIAVLLASPATLLVFATQYEHRSLGELVNFHTGSWSLMLGDTFVLTTFAAVAALAWRSLEPGKWASWWWTLICTCFGLAAGVAFHLSETKTYLAVGAGSLLNSPTKLFHDFVSYPVLLGGLLCIGLPVFRKKSWHRWVLLVCLVVQVGLMAADVMRGPNPFDLHPAWSWETTSVVSR